ncbi:RlpA-like double-psi beta-barrel-protein domain-containing protein-containing protein [Mycena polygramma]|nr:RlpA-like double-psi beta-barrel-protein domain-containing protein-containing protein [Mycena polygramma]KAJ7679212.1 RlpA-like double-psi beta-barrel-protein domain-containing protein-containing protein [Mycena polygramma]
MYFSKTFTALFATVLATAVNAIGPFDGLATYYEPNGGTGACGWAIQNSDFAVAIGSGHWDGGSHCGNSMTVSFNGATVQATVADLCPGCQGDNGIDLTPAAIAAIDPNYVNNGVDSVTWSVA